MIFIDFGMFLNMVFRDCRLRFAIFTVIFCCDNYKDRAQRKGIASAEYGGVDEKRREKIHLRKKPGGERGSEKNT